MEQAKNITLAQSVMGLLRGLFVWGFPPKACDSFLEENVELDLLLEGGTKWCGVSIACYSMGLVGLALHVTYNHRMAYVWTTVGLNMARELFFYKELFEKYGMKKTPIYTWMSLEVVVIPDLLWD